MARELNAEDIYKVNKLREQHPALRFHLATESVVITKGEASRQIKLEVFDQEDWQSTIAKQIEKITEESEGVRAKIHL